MISSEPIKATVTLTFWRPLGSATAGIDGSFQFLDFDAPNHPVRFYRGETP